MPPNDPYQNLSSDEFAALLVSGGQTKDPVLAEIIDKNHDQEINMDKLMQAHLRRQMGFDFKVKLRPPQLLVIAQDGSGLLTRARIDPEEIDRYGNVVGEEVIQKLADCCVRLKAKWDKRQAEQQ